MAYNIYFCQKGNVPIFFHNFADFNNVVGLKFLLDNGANVNVKNQYKQTPLDRAKARNNREAIDLLNSY